MGREEEEKEEEEENEQEDVSRSCSFDTGQRPSPSTWGKKNIREMDRKEKMKRKGKAEEQGKGT